MKPLKNTVHFKEIMNVLTYSYLRLIINAYTPVNTPFY